MSDDLPQADQIDGAAHPRDTDRLFGQDAASGAFLEALTAGRLHHAWLITGPEGVGKATLAWKLATTLLTHEPDGGMFAPAAPTLDIAPDHPVRARLVAGSEPRFAHIRRPWDEKAKRLRAEIPVDEVRRLKSYFSMSAADGGHRVAIIDAVDDLNVNAANALLKLLEEPPKDVTLLLVNHQPARILPTIRSRCRTLRCAALNPDDMAAALAQAGLDPGADAPVLAALAGGSVGRSVHLMQADGLKLYASLVALLSKAPAFDRPAALALAEQAAKRGAEARRDLIIDLIDLLLARLARAGVTGVPEIQAAPGEALLMQRLSPDVSAARHWASLQQTLGARARRGTSVNLDPAALIFDMILRITEDAGRLPA